MKKINKKLFPQNGRINENSLLLLISLAQGINMNPTSQADDRRKDLTDQSCVNEEITPAFHYHSLCLSFLQMIIGKT